MGAMRHALPMIWRRSQERYTLTGNHCETCKSDYYPSKQLCPKCRRKGKLVEKQMPLKGKIYSYSEVHAAPKGFEHESPYFLAVIELENGVKVLSQVIDSAPESVVIGAPVEVRFRKIFEDNEEGAIAYGFKFKVTI